MPNSSDPFAELLDTLETIDARLSNTQPLVRAIGLVERNKVLRRITETKTDPLGNSWAPWSERTARERSEKGNAWQGLLWDTGELLHSIKLVVDPDSFELGSDLQKAKDLQEGLPNMAAREYLGWNEDDFLDYEALAIRYFEGGQS